VSYYRLFVFVLPTPEDISQLLDGAENRVTVQEMTCHGDSCAERTTAIYITVEEMGSDREALVDYLIEGAGLEVPG